LRLSRLRLTFRILDPGWNLLVVVQYGIGHDGT
jgi:hypothetical protein